jgi:hypothetical protein
MTNNPVEQAKYLLHHALERADRARIKLQTVMQEHEKKPGDIEKVLAASKELGDVRTEVGNARLRLHLMGATESIEPTEREFRRRYAETKEMPEHIDDLGTIEDAEEAFGHAQVRYYEAEMQARTMEEMYRNGRCGTGNLLAAFKEKFEAGAAYKFAGMRLAWLQPRSEDSSYDPTEDWTIN